MAEFQLIEAKYHDVYPFISPQETLKDAAKGKTVLITGAGTGIGKAMAKMFAQAGANTVVIAARRLEKLEEVKAEIEKSVPNSKIVAASLDVTDEQAVDSFFQKMKDDGIAFDVLINNAGAFTQGLIKDSVPQDWWKIWEINVKGPYLVSRAFLRSQHGKPGQIISVTSVGGISTMPELSGYGASKTALNRLTEWLALEGKEQGVTAVTVHPGGVKGTEMSSGAPEWMLPFFTETAELSAAVTLYLSTDRAAYLSGRYVDVRWDMEQLEGYKDRILSEDLLKTSLLGNLRPSF